MARKCNGKIDNLESFLKLKTEVQILWTIYNKKDCKLSVLGTSSLKKIFYRIRREYIEGLHRRCNIDVGDGCWRQNVLVIDQIYLMMQKVANIVVAIIKSIT